MRQPSRKTNPLRATTPARAVALVLAFILAVSAGGMLIAAMALPAVIATSAATQAGTNIFDDLPDEIQMDAPSQRSEMLAADGSRIASFYADNRIVVPLEKISPYMQQAVVAIEDHRFFEHKGVDPEGIARALVKNVVRDGVEGASTLTQQYVKNALIERALVTGDEEGIHAAREQNYGRKLREAKLAVTLEKHHTKDEILAGYLNIAPFGPSVYGVEAAALSYFSKHAVDLTISEAATLASITQSPQKYDPLTNPDNTQERRSNVLAAMERDGYITAAERKDAEAVSVQDLLKPQKMTQGCASAGIAAYFCEYVTQIILNDKTFGETPEDRRRLLYRGGLVIHTTLDPVKQKAAHEAVVGVVPPNDPSKIDVGLSSVEPGTGKILAMAQNSMYGDPTEDNPRAKKINLNVEKAYGGGLGYHTGSTGKIFALLAWLQDGHSLKERVNAQRSGYTSADFEVECAPEYNLAPGDVWAPKNLEVGPGGNMMTVLDATKYSVNKPFADIASRVDLCKIRKAANDLGALTRGSGEPLEPRPAMVLGTNNLTPLTMANVGATLAAHGKRCMPIAITKVTNAKGEELPIPDAKCEQTIPQNVADTAVYAMQQVVSPGGTGERAILSDRPAAGKTGTADTNHHAWFVGFTPQVSAAVWMGHFDGEYTMSYQRVNGQWVGQLYGGLLPAPTWKNYMEVAVKGMPVQEFAAPDPKLVELQGSERDRKRKHDSPDEKAVPNVVGYTVENAKKLLERAGFQIRVGAERPSKWQKGVVAAQDITRAAKGATITVYPSSGPQG